MKLRNFIIVLVAAAIGAQPSARRSLTHKDYDAWRSIVSPTLSRDGRYLAYGLFPQEGDGEAILRDLKTGSEKHESAGALPPPPEPNPDQAREEQARVSMRLAFTADGRYLVFSAFPSKKAADEAKQQKKEAPKGGLVMMETVAGTATRVENVKSFQVPERGGAVVAYLKESKPAETRPSSAEAKPPADADQRRGGSRPAGTSPGGPRRREYGTDLVLRDLAKGAERTFTDALEYSLSKDGKALIYTVSAKDEPKNGVYSAAVDGDGSAVPLLSGKGRYTKLSWNLKQSQLAFLSDRDDAASRQPKYKVYLWERGGGAPREAVSTSTAGFHSGYVVSDRGALAFTRDGEKLLLGCAPPGKPEPEAGTPAAPSDDKAAADLWHWRDPFVQPMQKVRAAADRARSFRAVYYPAGGKFVQLADETMPAVLTGDVGRYAIGADDRAYRTMGDYDRVYADYYLVDLASGARKKLLEKGETGFGGAPSLNWSPDGRYAAFYRDRAWRVISTDDGSITDVTRAVKSAFYDEEDDHPGPARPYGAAGWTRDGKWLLLYDRFDVWQVSPDGRTVKSATGGEGRKDRVQFRIVRLEREDDEDEPRGIDASKPLLLRAENEETRETGFWRARVNGDAAPAKLFMRAKNYRALGKAKDADVILLTQSSFDEFPDLRVTDGSFKELRKVSDANPQKSGLLWGTSELISFKNADGVPLKAALYKPENFDPKKKYPMMVYIYERLSQNMHNFVDPRPGHSINTSFYVSNGYLVLQPDIVYEVGWPGKSALKCVLPAIQAVVDRGFVNEDAIGIQGHSWGGYQTAYLVTQTKRFRAASAGAPVGNMTSAYNGIRWGTGMPRQFQYERDQSRIGGNLWTTPMRFFENSPVFFADRVATPLLMIHNDQDDAVPWYQGIELYLSLRRFGKEVYLFSYNGERHGLRKRVNQKDYTVRLQQFFDHFLKGAPAPEWMEKGVPYLDREDEKERVVKSVLR